MTAKEYLKSIRRWRGRIDGYGQRIEALRTKVTGMQAITYDKVRVQTSPENQMAEIIAQLIDIELRHARMLLAYQEQIVQCEEMIEGLEDERHEQVLAMRYIDGMSWERIAERTGYSYRNVTRLHGKALAAFERKYKDVLECPIKSVV